MTAAKYANLLAHYCLEIKPGDKVFVSTTMLAEPLVREFYKVALEAGAAMVEVDIAFRERDRIFLEYAHDTALLTPGTLASQAMESFDVYLAIRAPYNLREMQHVAPEKAKLRQQALAQQNRNYFERTADRRLKRNLCQWPTDASAQEAGMSLSEYEEFVFNACKLNTPDPEAAWLQLRKEQQGIVDHLNQVKNVRYYNPNQYAIRGGIYQSGGRQREWGYSLHFSLYLSGK